MHEKMKQAMMKLKAAVMELDACCMGDQEEMGEDEMPDQESMAEEGDYSGKGMMSEKPNLKKGTEMAMALMKKKGY